MPKGKGYRPRHKGAGITAAGQKSRMSKSRAIAKRPKKARKGKQVGKAFFGGLVSMLAPVVAGEVMKRL